jgi:hypothetical protein
MATLKGKQQLAPAKQQTAVAVQPSMEIVTGDVAPEYIKNGAGRGTENVTVADIAIPRLEIVQALSPAIKRSDPGYIPGAEQGMLNNSASRELYGEKVWVVPVYFTKQYLLWREQKLGGGFAGAFNSAEEAQAEMENRDLGPEEWQAIDTPQYLCLLMNGSKVTEVMVSMPRTKAKVSRQWQALIRLAEGDMFSRVYEIGTTEQQKDNNTFWNFTVKLLGYPPKPLYDQALSLYNRVKSGDKQVVMDVSGLNADEEHGSEM